MGFAAVLPQLIKGSNKPYVIVIATIGLVLSILGIADSTYLTIAHYAQTVTLACPETKFINCAKVTSSSYSVIHGVPLAVLGLVFFCGMLVLQLPMLWALPSQKLRSLRLGYAIIGLLSVFGLVYTELYKLDAICLYCTGVHILTVGLFITTVLGTSLIPAKAE